MNPSTSKWETYFRPFRDETVGSEVSYEGPEGPRRMIYADWIASGRLYGPIEKQILEYFGPFTANTHTETSEAGTRMTLAYHRAHQIIKEHVHAGPDDVIITSGFGMTGVINKFQRILGLKANSRCGSCPQDLPPQDRPVVFITHMEHHSNHTSWYETIADVVPVPPGPDMLVDLDELRKTLDLYKERKFKIGSFTACSNVTGIRTPHHKMARIMHEAGGVCFVDFAASAPYADMDMHPCDPLEKLDAIFFSPHKFLGGPGTSGVLIFDRALYHCDAPDQPGGGTVDWTNPWGMYKYIDDIELREDGGTPGFLLAMRAALAVRLKEQMGTAAIAAREDELVRKAFAGLRPIPGLHILADKIEERIGCISFYIDGIHYNLLVKLLSDRFGVQVRGGCACAGTYGHFLLNVSFEQSQAITDKINHGDLSEKPGWVRLSLHPTMADAELDQILEAVAAIQANIGEWQADYRYNPRTNEFNHVRFTSSIPGWVESGFTLKKPGSVR
jgi:selenocysteine lyase/cysteine desulfurase